MALLRALLHIHRVSVYQIHMWDNFFVSAHVDFKVHIQGLQSYVNYVVWCVFDLWVCCRRVVGVLQCAAVRCSALIRVAVCYSECHFVDM